MATVITLRIYLYLASTLTAISNYLLELTHKVMFEGTIYVKCNKKLCIKDGLYYVYELLEL
jgi:hypothetical protein